MVHSTDRRRLAENQLFDVYSRLARARAELELIENEQALVAAALERASRRLSVSETSQAEWECCEARRRVEALARAHAQATSSVTELACVEDRLLAQLLG